MGALKWYALVLACFGCAPAGRRAATPMVTPPKVSRPAALPAVSLPPRTAAEEMLRNAESAFLAKRYDDAARLFGRAWDLGVNDAITSYDAAVANIRIHQESEAFRWLDRAIGAGFTDVDALENEADFLALGAQPRFSAIVSRARTSASAPGPGFRLQALVSADQAERRRLAKTPQEDLARVWKGIEERDRERRRLAAEILATAPNQPPMELWAAALLFQHGDTLSDYQRARELAIQAIRGGCPHARRLAADAWDRWLQTAGYPQRFGTQSTCNQTCELDPVDPATTDAERDEWNVPPLAELKEDARNAQ